MKKSDFQNYKALTLEARQLRAYVETLDRALNSAGVSRVSDAPKGPHTGAADLGARIARYLEIKATYEAQRDRVEAQILTIEHAIQALESPAERLVMRYRYLEGRSWASVYSKIQRAGYSERQMYRLHGSALLKLREV